VMMTKFGREDHTVRAIFSPHLRRMCWKIYADVAAAGGHGEVGMHSTECHLVCFIFTHFRNRLHFNVQ